ncbi:hypothetical protein KHA80_12145 [Anaerobacillus sp. HL2]|nr:hypothetical protein KHA80_12145 [Anaerobacillus sp. HL2]
MRRCWAMDAPCIRHININRKIQGCDWSFLYPDLLLPMNMYRLRDGFAADFGTIDDTTYQVHPPMYWPSTPSDGEFVFNVLDEP